MVSEKVIFDLLEGVFDPEVPVLTIVDLGIVRSVQYHEKQLIIEITPTYIGCPAMQTIEKDIESKLQSNGIQKFEMNTELDLEDGVTYNKGQLKRAFSKMSNGKTANRPLLNNFIKMVA